MVTNKIMPSKNYEINQGKIKQEYLCGQFSKILPSNGLGPGPGKVGQGGLKVLHL